MRLAKLRCPQRQPWHDVRGRRRTCREDAPAKFRVKSEHSDEWPEIARSFTEATRSEPGCLWFECSRSLDDHTEYVLVEAFTDDEAGAAHVRSSHFRAAQERLPPHLAETPKIVNFSVPGTDWSELGELAVAE